MSSFCFGQQASLQGKDAKNKPQTPQAGKSKSTKYKTLEETKRLAVNDSHWSTKQLLVAFLVGIIVIIVGVVQRKNGTNRGNLMIIIIIIIIITVCIN